MSTSDQRAAMNPIAAGLDMLGLPKLDELVPVPADVAQDMGLPTVSSLVDGALGNVKRKIKSRSF